MRSPTRLVGRLVVLMTAAFAVVIAVERAGNQIGSSAEPLVTRPAEGSGGTWDGPGPRAIPTLRAPADLGQVRVPRSTLFGWALLETDTGKLSGSANAATVTNTVESMIKPWIAADYLRRLTENRREPTETALHELTLMLVNSDDPMGAKYYAIGGEDAVIARLIRICGLTHVTIKPKLWSWTTMTPRDAVRYGKCLADGRAAGPQWTAWVLDTMTHVRGGVGDQVSKYFSGGRWGIIDGLPADLAEVTSIKNGWTSYFDGWHVNCLAVNPHWVLAVMLHVASIRAGAAACASVAADLVVRA